MRLSWPGVITRFTVAPANVHELNVVPQLAAGTREVLVCDRNYWCPRLTEELRQENVTLVAPFGSRKRDPRPRFSSTLSRLRYRIDTVFGQLVDRYQVKRVWAKDIWHLHSRLLRKVLSHHYRVSAEPDPRQSTFTIGQVTCVRILAHRDN